MKNEDIIEQINYELKFLSKNINEMKANLNENYIYYLPWVGEELFIASVKFNDLSDILNTIKTKGEVLAVIDNSILYYSDFVSRSYNVRVNSSGALHREVSTWKYIAVVELIEFLKKFV